ncbi:hypothetical protein PGB90_008906 [Kerria lacca]
METSKSFSQNLYTELSAEGKKFRDLRNILYSEPNQIECLIKLNTMETDHPYLHRDCNEVYPNIFISNERAAKNKKFLKSVGVTHLLNAAEGTGIERVNTNSDYYADIEIKYLGLPLDDSEITQICDYFKVVADFIDEGINSGGKVLVNCAAGMSRSSTCVLAYLMIKKHMNIDDAIRQIRAHREILPNDGFLYQLIELNKTLTLNL